MNLMRIAQVTPVCESIPPKKYGGLELIASLLTEELVKRGHEVTLYATGDSITKAKLKSLFTKATGIGKDESLMHTANVSFAFDDADQFDIIHNHAGTHGIVLSKYIKTPVVTTLHDAWLKPGNILFEYYRDMCHFVAISKKQEENLKGLNFAGVVYNAIDTSKYYIEENKENYLLYFGDISPAKGADTAVKVAKDLKIKLIIAGKVATGNEIFFNKEIKPYIDNKNIILYILPDSKTRQRLLGKAKTLLFPISWEEPFGLVMIEAMSCGTPVVAFRHGSTPEVIKDEETGFVVDTYNEFLEAVKKTDEISPAKCRKHVEDNFSIKKMTDGYEKIYQNIINRRRK